MRLLVGLGGVLLILVVLGDAFETIALPRRVSRSLRLTRLFYRWTWTLWSALARRMSGGNRRETYLSFYGPLSLILLLVVWAMALITGFALLQWGLGSHLTAPAGPADLGTDLYFSGTTFFTLGLGDVVPRTPLMRAITVVEAGTGFGFLALVIGYLPVLYQAFSRREVSISLLDARAGSPPSSLELLRRLGEDGHAEAIGELLSDWEHWSSELLESHISYPLLAYYRSQHDNQSWLAALTTTLDVCALVIAGIEGVPRRPARLTFAMARHAAVDLSQVFKQAPLQPKPDRLPPADLERLRGELKAAGVQLHTSAAVNEKLSGLRHAYEPYVNALATYLLMPLPSWLSKPGANDDWQASAWEHRGTIDRGTTERRE